MKKKKFVYILLYVFYFSLIVPISILFTLYYGTTIGLIAFLTLSLFTVLMELASNGAGFDED